MPPARRAGGLRRGALAALLGLAGALAAGAAPPAGGDPLRAPGDVEALMARFAASGGVRAHFHETRRLALLVEPLETRGVITFSPPDRLARETTWPGHSSIVVRAGRVAFRDETGHQVVDLGANDVARHFAQHLAMLLRGDLPALQTRYGVHYRSDGTDWVLELEPRSQVVRDLVVWTRFEGRGDDVSAMETRETNGDSTRTVFADVETGLHFSPSEIERIFALEEPDGTP